MADLDRTLVSKRKKTMLISFLISSAAPIVTGITAIISHSATQIADFLRRTAELISLFISWWVYRKLHSEVEYDDIYRVRMERVADITVSGAMICSGVAMFIVGVSRLFIYKISGSVIMGLIIATLGLLVNTGFWWRYSAMIRERFDPIIAGQHKLYRAKVFVDTAVVVALASVVVAPNHPIIKYIDALGCIIVSVYLLYNGLDIVRKNIIDKGVDST